MPAYFDLEFQYKKSDINSSTVKDFFSSLTGCGLAYKCGYWHSENDSLEEILTWNKAKIQSNFELGYDEHFSNDYKQMLFEFNDFSEVRLFINNESDCDSFSFYLIIPEDDFLDYSADDEVIKLTDRMNIIKDLAVRMWQAGSMSCIQTSWECSYYDANISDIINGKEPKMEPFAVIPEEFFRSDWKCEHEKIGRSGILLTKKDHWLYM